MNKLIQKIFLFVLLLWAAAANAADLYAPIIWIDEGVSLQGRTSIVLREVTNDTGQEYEFDVTGAVAEALREGLVTGGIEVLDSSEGAPATAVVVMSSVTMYEVGSAMERWFLPGSGLTICSVRARLLDAQSNRLLGEIISTKVIGAGGLFSVGADKYVPKQAGKEIAESLVPLLTGGVRE